MAFGIRELSKRLGHIRLKLKVKNVFLLTKAHDVHLIENTRIMSEWLLDQKDVNYTVWVEDTLKDQESFDASAIHKNDQSRKDRLRYWNNELCQKRPHTFDIVIAVSKYSAPQDIPLIPLARR